MSATESSVITETNRIVHLEDSRMHRRERAELATQAMAAFTLLNAAFASQKAGETGIFLIVNVVAGAALAIAVVRSIINMRRNRDAVSAPINIVGVFGGLATIAEGMDKLHKADFTFGHKHFALGTVTVLLGLVTTALAMMMGRVERHRVLAISDEGIRMRLNKFRRFKVLWKDVAELRLTAAEARVIDAEGKVRVVPLARLVNSGEVAEALSHAFSARGVPVTTVDD
ncbi:MAG: hypothetical protein ABI026_11620 [Gemmatimonadaceae bacterium]